MRFDQLFLLVAFVSFSRAVPTLDPPSLLDSLRTKKVDTTNVLLSMTELTQLREGQTNLKKLRETSFPSRSARLNAVAKFLKDKASLSQSSLSTFLNDEKTKRDLKIGGSTLSVKQLWITNQIIIRNADLTLIESLMLRDDVREIQQEKFFKLIDPVTVTSVEDDDPFIVTEVEDYDRVGEEFQWGVAKINAPAVYNVTKGENVVIGSIDTGAYFFHEALVANYRFDYGWFDGTEEPMVSRYPYDDHGHGTHTVGTMVGGTNGIGVAPGAKWIACKAITGKNTASLFSLLYCGQWILCPTTAVGENEDCSMAPHVVSNSWGGIGAMTFYDEVIEAWRAGGIIPVFSIGNAGESGCGSAGSPGDNPNVIGVGSTSSTDQVSYFSSRGPPLNSTANLIKPDIVAPGEGILSASFANQTGYVLNTGTSMAAPHISGVVALMLSKNPHLTFDEIKDALIKTAVHTIPTNEACGGVKDDIYPNYHVGYGRVDALASVSYSSSTWMRNSGPVFLLIVFFDVLWNL